MTTEDDRHKERMEEYDRKRKVAIKAVKALTGPNPDALPLAEIAVLLPDHPEWAEYRAKKRRKQ